LDALRAQNQDDLSVEDVDAIVAGIAAAPDTGSRDAALELLAPDRDQALSDALHARVEAAAQDQQAAFEDTDGAARVAALRAELERQSLDGFIVPRNDEHNGEYVPRGAERLAWLTGFTGSAGIAAVLADRAAIFVDGRYTLQVQDQSDGDIFDFRHVSNEPLAEWLKDHAAADQQIGYDPWLHTSDAIKRLDDGLAQAGATLVAVDTNPIDAIWLDQAPPPLSPTVPHPIEFAGESAEAKRSHLAESLKKSGVGAAVLTLPDSIAWLLNIRGGDVPRTPFSLGFAILHDDGTVDLLTDPRKLTPATLTHLGNAVRVNRRDAFGPLLDRLGAEAKRVRVDPASAGVWIRDRLAAAGASIDAGVDPCQLPKARKNATEIAGTRSAHLRDGIAVCRFLHWLSIVGPKGDTDELGAVDQLAAFRREGQHFRDLSFDTISGAGPNGAIVHYRVTPESNRKLAPDMLYLVDSGAQYLDGTTDVTRTIAIGQPSDAMRGCFTRVLKGHIAIATCRFPKGTSGGQLDSLARHALWQAGLDFDHGTGHGVGSYLSVHEGPQRISKAAGGQALEPGMIVSNEPGYYRTGEFGIRIENLVVVVDCPDLSGEREMLQFDTLTRAPIDRRLIDRTLLSDEEVAWLDAYHEIVRQEITPLVDTDTGNWLADVTQPL
jgi:Xaa-Pro aminopeptidase